MFLDRQYWWGYNHYEIRNGYIKPKNKAKLIRYDAMREYKKAEKRPYESLLKLINSLKIKPKAQSELVKLSFGEELQTLLPEEEKEVIKWYNAHGPLGILLQQVSRISLAGTYRDKWGDISGMLYFRTPRGWRAVEMIFSKDGEIKDMEDVEELINAFPPTVWAQDFQSYDYWAQPISRFWTRFFPSIPEDERDSFQYPLPLSEDFWKIYEEPVEDFLQWAQFFTTAVTALHNPVPAPVLNSLDLYEQYQDFFEPAVTFPIETLYEPRPPEPKPTTMADNSEIGRLNWLLATASFSLARSRTGRVEQIWFMPSLIGLFALMASLDSITGLRMLNCPVCKETFFSKSPKAKYYPARCKETARKRRQRQRNRLNKFKEFERRPDDEIC